MLLIILLKWRLLMTKQEYFELKQFIGFGSGAGANILMRYALKFPKHVAALILINATYTAAGWMEWGYHKVNISYLRTRVMTTFTVDYLMWHHFGRHLDTVNPDMIESYKHYFTRLTKPANLAGFLESWIARTPIDIDRNGTMIQCPVIQFIGSQSPHLNETIEVNARLNPAKSDWMKIDGCGLILEDQPAKVTEALILFLQGMSYLPCLSHVKWVASRSASRSNSMQMENGAELATALKKHINSHTTAINEGLGLGEEETEERETVRA